MTRAAKRLIAPDERGARYLNEVVSRALDHKKRSDELIREANRALRNGNLDDAIRLTSQARELRESYFAAASIDGEWRLPEPVHYVKPDKRGGLPVQGSKEDLPACGSKKSRAKTCLAACTTCPECLGLLLEQFDSYSEKA